MSVIYPHISMESNMLNYAAVRGDEVIPFSGEVDTRLAMLALLEGKCVHTYVCLTPLSSYIYPCLVLSFLVFPCLSLSYLILSYPTLLDFQPYKI